jgi:hypothetical protein
MDPCEEEYREIYDLDCNAAHHQPAPCHDLPSLTTESGRQKWREDVRVIVSRASCRREAMQAARLMDDSRNADASHRLECQDSRRRGT